MSSIHISLYSMLTESNRKKTRQSVRKLVLSQLRIRAGCGKGKSIKTVRNPVKKKVLARKNVFVHVFLEKKVIQCSYKYSAKG